MPNIFLDALKEKLKEHSVVTILGAGVSISATGSASVASWRGLLRDGVSRCEAVVRPLPNDWAARARGDIESADRHDLLTGAERVSDRLQSRHVLCWRDCR